MVDHGRASFETGRTGPFALRKIQEEGLLDLRGFRRVSGRPWGSGGFLNRFPRIASGAADFVLGYGRFPLRG